MVGIFNHELFVLRRRLRSARPSPFSRFVLFLSSRVRRYRLTPSFLQLPPKISVGANYKTRSTLPALAGLSARRLAKARPSPTTKRIHPRMFFFSIGQRAFLSQRNSALNFNSFSGHGRARDHPGEFRSSSLCEALRVLVRRRTGRKN